MLMITAAFAELTPQGANTSDKLAAKSSDLIFIFAPENKQSTRVMAEHSVNRRIVTAGKIDNPNVRIASPFETDSPDAPDFEIHVCLHNIAALSVLAASVQHAHLGLRWLSVSLELLSRYP
jgi:hypothetical protein